MRKKDACAPVSPGVTTWISPTYLTKLEVIKTCDILNPGFQGLGGDNCYENQDIRQLKSCDIHNIHAIILRFQIVGSMARYLHQE